MDDYENLLERAIDQLPPEVFESCKGLLCNSR